MSLPRRRFPAAAAALVAFAAALAATPRAVARADSPDAPTLEKSLEALASPDSGVRRAAVADLERRFAGKPVSGDAMSRLRESVRAKAPETRAATVAVLARAADPEAERLWLDRLEPDEDDRVIAAALDGVGKREPGSSAERALIAIADDAKASPGRRGLALEALGGCEGPAAGLVLAAPRRGGDWMEESGRALGLLRRGGDAAVPPLIDLLGHAHRAVRVHAWEGLTRITRVHLPAERAPWAAWWEARPKGAPLATGRESVPVDAYADDAPAHVPTYYGIAVPRRDARVAFCLDISASMNGHGIDEARAHLVRTIEDLPSTAAFEVICFNERVIPWAGRLVAAHPTSKARAIAFLEAQKPVSFTNIYDAVEAAFALAGRGPHPSAEPSRLDAVYLLSDGAPNRGRYQVADDVVRGIAALSAGTIPVHAVGAGDAAMSLLRRVAAVTGGRFVDAFTAD